MAVILATVEARVGRWQEVLVSEDFWVRQALIRELVVKHQKLLSGGCYGPEPEQLGQNHLSLFRILEATHVSGVEIAIENNRRSS